MIHGRPGSSLTEQGVFLVERQHQGEALAEAVADALTLVRALSAAVARLNSLE